MDYRAHPINLDWPAEGKIDLLRQMCRSRRFEQQALKNYIAGKIGGWLILGVGQESVAHGVRSLMGPQDHSISGPRGIAHAIAAGMPMGPGMAELFGKASGCSKGKGGMLSFYYPPGNFWGCHGLAAAQTPLAAGLAFATKQRGMPGAVVCFLGDGAVNQGVYHESLNLAGLFGLPVVYLIENNGYAMGMSIPRSSRFTECLARRAEGYDIEWDRCGDGDIHELRVKVWTALERARHERRPTVLEVETYRYHGFCIADANNHKYRTPAEIEEHKARDPLGLWRQHLINEGIIGEAAAGEIDSLAREEAIEAAKFAESASPPMIEDILRDVYWESDHATEASRIGRHFFGE